MQNIPLEEMNPIERSEVIYQRKNINSNFSHVDYVTHGAWHQRYMLYLPRPTGDKKWEFSAHEAGKGVYVRDRYGPAHFVTRDRYKVICDWAHSHGLEVHRFVHMGEVYHPVVID